MNGLFNILGLEINVIKCWKWNFSIVKKSNKLEVISHRVINIRDYTVLMYKRFYFRNISVDIVTSVTWDFLFDRYLNITYSFQTETLNIENIIEYKKDKILI